jgi:hypothetical protein
MLTTRIVFGLAGAERFELPQTVLETVILPLNYAPVKAHLPLGSSRCAIFYWKIISKFW